MTPKPSISIHALLAESDDSNKYTQEDYQQFLSTLSLRRATLAKVLHLLELLGFLSTLSLRRATGWQLQQRYRNGISIHALLAESDSAQRAWSVRHVDFYPRSPCGERQKGSGKSTTLTNFYPRSPCGERRCVIFVMICI